MAIARHCNWNATRRRAVLLGCSWSICTAHDCTNCYFPAFDRNYDIIIRFSDDDFSEESNNSAIRRRFHAVTLTFDLWHFTMEDCSTSGVTWSNSVTVGGWGIDQLVNFRTFLPSPVKIRGGVGGISEVLRSA